MIRFLDLFTWAFLAVRVLSLISQGNVIETGRGYKRSQPITARHDVTERYKGCCCNSQTIHFNTTTNKHGRQTRAVLTLRTTMARSCDDMNPYLSPMNTRSPLVFDEEYQNTWGPLWMLKMAPTVGSQGGLTGTVMARMRPGGLALLPWTKQMFAVLWGQLRLLLRVIYYTVMSGKNHIQNPYVTPQIGEYPLLSLTVIYSISAYTYFLLNCLFTK